MRGSILAWLSTVLIGGCGNVVDPASHAGVVVVGTLGVTMGLPDGAAITMEGDDVARIRVEGTPDLVVTRIRNASGRIVDETLGQDGRVTVTRAGRGTSWSCAASDVSDALVNRVKALCATLRPPDAPGISEVRCRDGRGRVDEAREAWLRQRAAPIVACYAAEIERSPALGGGVFVLAAEHEGGARVREQHGFAAPGHVVGDPACFDRAAASLEGDAGYAPVGGAGRSKCTVQLSRF